MKRANLIVLFLFALIACKSEDPAAKSSRKCYKDQRFSGIQAFYCLSDSEAADIRDQKLRGQTQVNLIIATDADKAQDTNGSCTSCR